MKKVIKTMLGVGAVACSSSALEVGKPAPDFKAETTAGPVAKSDFAGRWLVLYFYPKSFTPGCTKQICSVRDGFAELKKNGVTVLGVSVDHLDRQKDFKKKYEAPFELVADAKGELAKAFDNLGVGGLTAKRRTFIISPDGKLAAIIEKPDVNDHATQILKEIEKLKAGK